MCSDMNSTSVEDKTQIESKVLRRRECSNFFTKTLWRMAGAQKIKAGAASGVELKMEARLWT